MENKNLEEANKGRYNKILALTWSKLVPPLIPSTSEINIYTEIANKLREKLKRKLDILILGATVEFRDWAYEENFNVTVIDKNYEYYKEISDYLRHKNISNTENVIISKWEDMNFENEFDIIIGDLTLGFLQKNKLELFIQKINNSLRNNGLFLGKNFLIPNNYNKVSLEEIAENFNLFKSYYNPISYMIYDLVIHSVNYNNLIDFRLLYNELLKLKDKNLINDEVLKKFEIIKLESQIDLEYNVPTIDEYETLIKKYLNIREIRYGLDIYSKNFPLYIIEKI